MEEAPAEDLERRQEVLLRPSRSVRSARRRPSGTRTTEDDTDEERWNRGRVQSSLQLCPGRVRQALGRRRWQRTSNRMSGCAPPQRRRLTSFALLSPSRDSARPASPYPAPSPRPSSRQPVLTSTTSTNEMDHLNLVDSVTAGGLGYGAGIDDLDAGGSNGRAKKSHQQRRAAGDAAGGAGDESSSEEAANGRPRRRKVHAVRPRAGFVTDEESSPPPGPEHAGPMSGGLAEGKVDIEDGVAYCYCNGPSYGEMIGCDSDDCEREWVRLSCALHLAGCRLTELSSFLLTLPICSSISSACNFRRLPREHGTARPVRRRRTKRRRQRRLRVARWEDPHRRRGDDGECFV